MDAVVFDLDDTLVVEEESARAAFTATCQVAHERCGVDPQALQAAIRGICRDLWYRFPEHPYCLRVGISSWEGLWAEFLGESPSLVALRHWGPTYRAASWRHALTQCGLDNAALALELANIFVNERRKLHIVYDDVLPVLARLKQTHRLGLLTNGAPDLQRRKLAGAGLAGAFHEVVISGEIGLGKPDEHVFKLMLARLETPPGAAVMVGNSPKSDIRPAQAVGMKAVWVNRYGRAGDPTVMPDCEIKTLTELVGWLESA